MPNARRPCNLVTAAIAAALAASVAAADVGSPGSQVIRFLEDRVARDPDDILALNRLASEYIRRFRETGDDADLDRSFKAAEQSLKAVPAEVNAAALAARARAAFSLHRFTVTRDDARRLAQLDPGKPYPLELLGDALLELGEYAEAEAAYGELERRFHREDPSATTEVRLARLAFMKGDTAGAVRRLGAAVDLARVTPVPSPELLAWALVQAGQLDFSSGRWDDAERRYLAALEAKPGDWPALDHLAELRAAQKRFDESISIYRELIARVPRPELFQALGDVYRAMDRPDDARGWHARALAAYRKAADAGSSHYFHHLAAYYCDVEPDPAEAVRWARADLEVRRNVYAYDALAWALYHAGDYRGAAHTMDKALAPGTADAHVLYHASLIYARAGDADKGRLQLRRAAAANPKFTEFHVHR